MIINLKANEAIIQPLRGYQFAANGMAPTAVIAYRFFKDGELLEEFATDRRFTAEFPDGFTRVEFKASANTALDYQVSRGRVRFDFSDGATVNANINGTVPVSVAGPLAVVNDRGAVGNPVYVSGITYSDAPASSIVDSVPYLVGPFAAGAGSASFVGANANRKSIRVMNQGPDQVAIGSSGLTWAKRVVVLEPGDVWEENRAANLAWFAVCDAGKFAIMAVQGVLA